MNRSLLCVGMMTAVSLVALSMRANAQGSTQCVSLDSTGVQANEESYLGSFSADGRLIMFESEATNLAQGDVNGASDIFIHDRVSGVTTLVSQSISGVPGNAPSFFATFTPDGRFVAFASSASDLVANDANGNATDMFVRDLLSGTTELVSVSSAGEQANGDSGWGATSADGRYVAFLSRATNLVAGVVDGSNQVFLRDRVAGTTILVSRSSSGAVGDGDCWGVAISANGSIVSFGSTATNLVSGDSNQMSHVFVHEIASGVTECISATPSGLPGNGWSYNGELSADGRIATFASYSSDLIAGGTNGQCHEFVRDRLAGTTEIVSVDTSGNEGNGYSWPGNLSADGRFISFGSMASNLVAGDTNQSEDSFVHDRLTGETFLAGLTSTGHLCQYGSYGGRISPDGRHVAFSGQGEDIIPGGAHGHVLLFVRDLDGCSATVATYCAAGTTTSGCVPTISGSGTPSASAGSGFTIDVATVEGHKNGMFFYGLAGPEATAWGSSFLCVRSPLQRMGVVASGGASGSCIGQLSIDWNAYIATHPSSLGSPFVSGETVWVQAMFRDPTAPGGSNASDALWFTVCH